MTVIKSINSVIIMSSYRNGVRHLFVLIAIQAVIGGANALPPRRIVGGRLAYFNEFGGTITLSYPGQFVHGCGGAIIGPRHVLTAAHCVETKKDREISIHAGIIDMRDTYNVIERLVIYIIKHPGYVSWIKDQRYAENDIAILVLDEDLPIGIRITSFTLPTHQPKMGYGYIVSGWGNNDHNSTIFQYQLKTLTMTLLDPDTCGVPARQMMCAYSNVGTTCSGDSGGPLEMNGCVYGIVSSGSCKVGSIVTFVNVYNYLDWINYIISDTSLL